MDRPAKNVSSAPVEQVMRRGYAEEGPPRPASLLPSATPQSSRPPSPTRPSPSLASIVTVWVIFAPTAVCAGYALFTWARINRTRFNAIYAITLALFFAMLFGFLVFGTTRRYLRARANSRRR